MTIFNNKNLVFQMLLYYLEFVVSMGAEHLKNTFLGISSHLIMILKATYWCRGLNFNSLVFSIYLPIQLPSSLYYLMFLKVHK